MRLALFDLDNTLLAGDSDYEWGQFLVDRGILDREAYEVQNRAYYEQYVAGTLDIHEYLGFALRPLAEHTAQDLARWHAEFMRTRIVPMIAAGALGNWIGEVALHHTTEQRFRLVFQLVLTALGLRLLWGALPDLGWF